MITMPRGGARVVSGPPPDPNALRRDRPGDKAWTTLPAEGRPGRPPEWPLTEQSPREAELWADFWSRPQAVMWERLDQRYEVAMCVRMLERAESPKSSIELQKVVRQYFDSLGLSVQGMLRNRWRLSDSTASGQPTSTSTSARRTPARKSARDRLKVVPSSGSEGA